MEERECERLTFTAVWIANRVAAGCWSSLINVKPSTFLLQYNCFQKFYSIIIVKTLDLSMHFTVDSSINFLDPAKVFLLKAFQLKYYSKNNCMTICLYYDVKLSYIFFIKF